MRPIDADAYCAFLRKVSTRQHYETLLTKKDKYPTVADVIEEICCDLDGTSLNGFDNAPTIDSEPNDCVLKEFGKCNYNESGCSDCFIKERIRRALDEKAYESGHADGARLGYEKGLNDARPKGKWEVVSTSEGTHFYGCSECQFAGDISDKFCRRCGADMR